MQVSAKTRRRIADRLAAPMFCLALGFLIIVAILLVLWVDVPLFFHGEGEPASGQRAQEATEFVAWITPETAIAAGYACIYLLVAIWPIFFLEFALQFAIRDRSISFWRHRYYSLFVCLLPPLRMCARNYDHDENVWFPSLGWQEVDDKLRERLEKVFSVPMIFIALTILPVLLVEFGMRHHVLSRPWLQCVLHVSTGVIWFAFAAEFVVMVSVAEKKLRYCKSHWLDLAIIVLPFISFLRSLRIVRATRLARVAKVQQLTRMGRLYRLRGLAMRAVRALMILELLNRLFRIGPERQLRKLRAVLEEREHEMDLLREHIRELEQVVAQQAAEGAGEEQMSQGRGVGDS